MSSSRRAPREQGSYDFLQHQLAICLSKHEFCRRDFYGKPRDVEHTPRLPARVLFVGRECDEHLKLIEQPIDAKDPVNGRYIALSHCWGPPEKHSITTTVSNIDQHRECIAFESLSRTFKDAVRITRKLGILYLWIDSLCIVQDLKTDWEQQAPTMGSVYEEAFLTICATGARDGTDGCFSVVEAAECLSLPIRSTDCPKDSLRWEYTSEYRTDVLGPLQNRAWITQEWILSLRQIHYCRGGLVWNCQTVSISDDGGSPVNMGILDPSFVDATHLSSGWGSEDHHTRADKVKEFWRWIVEEYSERSLTQLSDKLAAMLGLIRKLENDNENGIPYGIRADDLPYSLAWSRWEDGEYLERPYELRALGIPSWSWASTMGRIDYSRAFVVDRTWDVGNYWYHQGYGTMVVRPAYFAAKFTSLSSLRSQDFGNSASFLFDTAELANTEETCNQEENEYVVFPILIDYYSETYHCLILKLSTIRAGVYERVGMIWYLDPWPTSRGENGRMWGGTTGLQRQQTKRTWMALVGQDLHLM